MAEREQRPRREPLPARLLGAGTRGAARVAEATGLDDAVERTAEEALLRAIESGTVERVLVRALESPEARESLAAALSSPAFERALTDALDSRTAERVWDHILASDEAQRLVERVAEAPEVRAAIASQGVGLINDLGRQVREIADRFDDAIERLGRRLRRRPQRTEPATRVGLVTRTVAALVDGGILNLIFLGVSAIFGITVSGVIGDDDGTPASALAAGALLWIVAGATYLGFFWTFVGQTPGMRFLSIRLDVDGERHVGSRRALRRLWGTALCVLSFGIGFLAALFDERRRTLADRIAGTEVVEDDERAIAPHSVK